MTISIYVYLETCRYDICMCVLYTRHETCQRDCTYLPFILDMPHSYVPWLIHRRRNSFTWDKAPSSVTRLIHVARDSFVRDMTHSHVYVRSWSRVRWERRRSSLCHMRFTQLCVLVVYCSAHAPIEREREGDRQRARMRARKKESEREGQGRERKRGMEGGREGGRERTRERERERERKRERAREREN